MGEFDTVVDVLRVAAVVNADSEAYVEPETETTPRKSVTFAEWDRAADGVAGLLAGSGVTRGSVVCLLLPSSIDYMICYAAAARLGAITSGINLRLGVVEVRSILDRARPTVTVIDGGATRPEGPSGTVLDRAAVASAVAGPPAARVTGLRTTDPVAVVWTSGTTGLPKGAVFDHDSLRAVADGTDVLSQPGDRRLSPLPFAHVGSMTRMWDEIANGVTTVITPTPWKAADTIRIIGAEQITVAQGVPTQWALVLAHPDLDGTDVSSLRIAGTGTVPGDPDQVVATTVGRPVPGVSLTVADDAGRPVASGEVGRVRLTSRAVMRGYWGGPSTGPGAGGVCLDVEATGSVLGDDGWLTTGDYGFVDGDGNLHLVGRANELYIRGGYNVYPAEVEGALSGHPGVEQVAVIGAPDPVLGEIGVVVVVPSDHAPVDADRLLDELRDMARRSLADYKAPDRIVVAGSLPLTSMMKVDKRALAAIAAQALSGGTDHDHHANGWQDRRQPTNGVSAS